MWKIILKHMVRALNMCSSSLTKPLRNLLYISFATSEFLYVKKLQTVNQFLKTFSRRILGIIVVFFFLIKHVIFWNFFWNITFIFIILAQTPEI